MYVKLFFEPEDIYHKLKVTLLINIESKYIYVYGSLISNLKKKIER